MNESQRKIFWVSLLLVGGVLSFLWLNIGWSDKRDLLGTESSDVHDMTEFAVPAVFIAVALYVRAGGKKKDS